MNCLLLWDRGPKSCIVNKSSGIQPKMTQTQQDQMINKIYQLVDSHFPEDEPNDDLIDELCTAFETICPVTV